jgi:hypothetical protein
MAIDKTAGASQVEVPVKAGNAERVTNRVTVRRET